MPHDRNPSDPEDDANCFAPLAVRLSEYRANGSNILSNAVSRSAGGVGMQRALARAFGYVSAASRGIPRRGALAHQSKACERHVRARGHSFVIRTSSYLLTPRGFQPAYGNGMTVALIKTYTLTPATAMSLLITFRRTLYALFSVRFIEMQKKPVRVR
ncbi:MAG TPA: hypothetical protein VGN31_09330 [Paraburkholderia sp.]